MRLFLYILCLLVMSPLANAGWFSRNTLPQDPQITKQDVISNLGAYGISWGPHQKNCENLLTLKSKEYRADTYFGDPETIATMINYSLEAAGPQGSELLDLFKSVRRGTKAFKKNLNAWATSQGVQLMSLSELGIFVKAKTKEGALPEMKASEVIAFNGFINDLVYTEALRSGQLIVADPHDFFSHIPSLLDPDFIQILKEHGNLVHETGLSFGEQNLTPRQFMSLSPKAKMDYKLHQILTGPIRNFSVENWSYLTVNEEEKPQLFLQGNRSFNAIVSLVNGRGPLESAMSIKRRIVDILLVAPFGPDSLYPFEHLPKWKDFVQSQTGHELDRDLKGLLSVVQLNGSEHFRMTQDIEAEVTQFESSYRTRAEKAENFPQLFDKIALKFHSQPELAQTFSRESRINLSKKLLKIVKAYRIWILNSM